MSRHETLHTNPPRFSREERKRILSSLQPVDETFEAGRLIVTEKGRSVPGKEGGFQTHTVALTEDMYVTVIKHCDCGILFDYKHVKQKILVPRKPEAAGIIEGTGYVRFSRGKQESPVLFSMPEDVFRRMYPTISG